MISGVVQIILVRVGHKVTDEVAEKIIELIIMIFQNQHKVTENGLIAFSGLCNGIKERIKINKIGQFLMVALKGEDDECVRLACGIVSDIANALEAKIGPYIADFVPALLNILKEARFDRDSKLQAIMSLGDICMNCGDSFVANFLGDTLRILNSASLLA